MADSTINIFGSSGEAMVGADTINTILASMDSKLTSDDINIETLGDGTVDVDVKNDTYTINLNHEHEGMAKLVVDTAANLPDASEMESDTIYGELDDGEIATIYLGGYPFYGGGGGASSGPVLRRPADGATIDMGQTTSGTVSKAINVKGKSLTQALTIELDGIGYSFGSTQPSGVTRDSSTQLTVTTAAANALNGVDIVVVFTHSTQSAGGTLSITSSSPDNIYAVCSLVTFEDIAGVKLTGQQYIELDYRPNPNTKLEIDMQFEENENKNSTTAINYWTGTNSSTENGRFQTTVSSKSGEYGVLVFWYNDSSSVSGLYDYGDSIFNRSTFTYDNNAVNFQGVNKQLTTKTTTQIGNMLIGAYYSGNAGSLLTFNKHNIKIFSIKISEGGTTLLNLVPKLKNGTVGLYDTLHDTFYSSETATPLVAITT